MKVLENKQKQTDSTGEYILTWRKENRVLYKSASIFFAFGLKLSATLATHITSRNWKTCHLFGLENKRNEAKKLNAEETGSIT